MEDRSLVMNEHKIQQKLDRIARQIYETHFDQDHIVLVGISNNGYAIGERLLRILREISPIDVQLASISLDKKDPLSSKPELSIADERISNAPVILVDDVLNSGKTLIHAASHLINRAVQRLTTVVLIDRKHRKYPIKADFVGMTLATTLKQHIEVELGSDKEGAYLE